MCVAGRLVGRRPERAARGCARQEPPALLELLRGFSPGQDFFSLIFDLFPFSFFGGEAPVFSIFFQGVGMNSDVDTGNPLRFSIIYGDRETRPSLLVQVGDPPLPAVTAVELVGTRASCFGAFEEYAFLD